MMYTNVKGYQIPNLSLPKAKKTNLNRYGRMRLDYLEQNEPNLCDQMMLEETLLPSCRDRKSTRLNSSHPLSSRMPSSA